MKSFYSLIILSIIGIIIAIAVIFYDQRPMESKTLPIPELTPPYKNFIAGTGVVESSSKNIQIGAMLSGVIDKVYVQSGDTIKKGELLFSLDKKIINAKITAQQSNIQLAKTKLKKAQHQFKILKNFKKISPDMVKKTEFAKAKDNVTQALVELHVAKSKLKVLLQKLSLYDVYSPIDGRVLESKLSIGKYFPKNSRLLTIGSNRLNLRVDINEYDVWKFAPGTNAVAFVRGHPKLKLPLQYLYTMPYVVPKKNLTGLSTERTDTRVLHALYVLPKKIDFPLFVGQQLDVFIESQGK